MPIVDMHAHVYPDKIAEKATTSVGQFYNVPMQAVLGSVVRRRPSPIRWCARLP